MDIRHAWVARFSHLAVGLLGLLLLGACQDRFWEVSDTPQPLVVEPVAVDPDPVGWRLAQAAEKASTAMHKMAEIEAYRTPMADQKDNEIPPDLQKTISITWTGPLDQVVRTLAEVIGYKFGVIGQASHVPLVVTVEAHDQPIGRILRDVGDQAGRRADVLVDTIKRTIDIRYAPVDGLTFN